MRGFLVLCVCLVVLLCQVRITAGQAVKRFPDAPIVCRYSHQNRPDHIPATEKFRQRLRQSGSARTKTSTFEVEYINFPKDNLAKTAFQHAIAIWETELISSVPIKVRAEWRSLGTGVVGEALWGSAHTNFGGEQHMNTFYPVALAEKIAGRELNDADEPDILASFNKNISWYLALDGNTPPGKMDFVTIVLHEIAHGLGFTDSYDVTNQTGSVGMINDGIPVPFVFDLFVATEDGKYLLHDFESPSGPLASELQSTNIFFDGVLSVASLDGVRPELYAPAAFNSGSSVSHLDEGAFNGESDANRLMTPQIAFAESIHDPGDVVRGMLSDMGWVSTKIVHEKLKDTERADGQPYPVIATIESDNGYVADMVKLHYSTDGENFTTIAMSPTGVANQFQSSLPGVNGNWAYGYFISVEDVANRPFTSPGKIQTPGKDPEQALHFFNIRTDIEAPKIVHEPRTWISEHETQMAIVAEVTDNLGVKEVVLEYILEAGPVQTTVMDKVPLSNAYQAMVSLAGAEIGHKIDYRIIARDLAGAENVSFLPLEAYYPVIITGIMPAQAHYSNNFNKPSFDFFGHNFSIDAPPEFQDPAIHSQHPYTDETGPADEGHYIYQLQIPIRIDEANPVIVFDEIVLVEPGEDDSEFGDNDFYDYVIVEGSVDGGVSWKPFAPGYDSRHQSAWLAAYESGLDNGVSESEGNPVLFRERVIDMLENGNFLAGDEVLIRFRLFADQLAHGWGWAIDNLSIQEPLTPVGERPLSTSLSVYPIPVEHNLFVELNTLGEISAVAIYNMQGQIIFHSEPNARGSESVMKKTIDVKFLKNGVYILKAFVGNSVYYRKFIKKG